MNNRYSNRIKHSSIKRYSHFIITVVSNNYIYYKHHDIKIDTTTLIKYSLYNSKWYSAVRIASIPILPLILSIY